MTYNLHKINACTNTLMPVENNGVQSEFVYSFLLTCFLTLQHFIFCKYLPSFIYYLYERPCCHDCNLLWSAVDLLPIQNGKKFLLLSF